MLITHTPPPQAEVATLANLTPRAKLWMRDPRRTPVCVTALSKDTASFTVEVLDFEDKGTQWTFPVWQSDKFLCDTEMPTLPKASQEALQTASHRLNQPLHVPTDATQRANTKAQLTKLTAQAHAWLTNAGHLRAAAQSLETFSAFTDPDALSAWLTHHDVQHIESDVATQYVSNPHAGETIKAHRLALADLGLCPFEGRILRDTTEITGNKSLPHRKRHILTRLAFLRAAFALLGMSHVPLYRVIYSDTALTPPRPNGFTSATFGQEVALRFLKAGQAKRHAALYWQHVPVTRLFMTHLETPQMRGLYDEREALLLSAPQGPLF
ncbi:hypothetical protein [Shimia sagamensis]|uniref:Uncharacterized protein n=1 Tax=Shimia sagamensis TaxID=1566352 RepID=A0ABY1NR02_9RHOB|nr:hypothetical protein [Shimia sagamensis]SMP14807.1 hypothetical protein SAMN06265373_102734 [Shimia sagamensis]